MSNNNKPISFFVRNGNLNTVDSKRWKDELDYQLSQPGWQGSAVSAAEQLNSFKVIDYSAYQKAIEALRLARFHWFRELEYGTTHGAEAIRCIDLILKELGEKSE